MCVVFDNYIKREFANDFTVGIVVLSMSATTQCHANANMLNHPSVC